MSVRLNNALSLGLGLVALLYVVGAVAVSGLSGSGDFVGLVVIGSFM